MLLGPSRIDPPGDGGEPDLDVGPLLLAVTEFVGEFECVRGAGGVLVRQQVLGGLPQYVDGPGDFGGRPAQPGRGEQVPGDGSRGFARQVQEFGGTQMQAGQHVGGHLVKDRGLGVRMREPVPVQDSGGGQRGHRLCDGDGRNPQQSARPFRCVRVAQHGERRAEFEHVRPAVQQAGEHGLSEQPALLGPEGAGSGRGGVVLLQEGAQEQRVAAADRVELAGQRLARRGARGAGRDAPGALGAEPPQPDSPYVAAAEQLGAEGGVLAILVRRCGEHQ